MVEGVFINILKSSLWGCKIEIPQNFDDWGALLKLANSHSVLGLIAHATLSEPILEKKVPHNIRNRLKSFIVSNVAAHSIMNNTIVKIVSELRGHSIEPILLKGQGIAKYYPVPDLRNCGDIDLFVGEENFLQSCNAIVKMPNACLIDDAIFSTKDCHLKLGIIDVEIHKFTDVYCSKRLNRIYQRYSEIGVRENLTQVNISGVDVLTPSLNFNIFYVFNHMFHHFMESGVGLRHVCDWVVLLHVNHSYIDYDYLEQVLMRMMLIKEWQVFGCIAVDYLGLPRNEMPFYDTKYQNLSKRVIGIIMRDGSFGIVNRLNDKRPDGYILGKLHTFKRCLYRSLRLMPYFPMQSLRQIWGVFIGGIIKLYNKK